MSNYHAYADTRDHLVPASIRPALSAIATALWSALLAPVSGVRALIERHAARQHFARLSDHMLRDSGFEREWDGTIHPISNDDAA